MIYRREKQGELVEGIEIVLKEKPTKNVPSSELFNNKSIKIDFLWMKEETLFYNVEIPNFLKVKPPDLRRYAYDHKKVDSLVTSCIIDNFQKYIFEPVNESKFEFIDQELFVALQDLNSILDIISVECQLPPKESYYSVNVTFECKNGVCRNLIIQIDSGYV